MRSEVSFSVFSLSLQLSLFHRTHTSVFGLTTEHFLFGHCKYKLNLASQKTTEKETEMNATNTESHKTAIVWAMSHLVIFCIWWDTLSHSEIAAGILLCTGTLRQRSFACLTLCSSVKFFESSLNYETEKGGHQVDISWGPLLDSNYVMCFTQNIYLFNTICQLYLPAH